MSIWFTTQIQVPPELEEGIRSPEVEPPCEYWAHQSSVRVLTPESSIQAPAGGALKGKGPRKF